MEQCCALDVSLYVASKEGKDSSGNLGVSGHGTGIPIFGQGDGIAARVGSVKH